VRGLEGKPVEEIDLTKDLGLSGDLVAPLRVGAATFKAESRGTEIVEAYEARRRDALAAWEAAFRAPDRAPLEKLGGVSRLELAQVAAMEPARRDAVARSVSSAWALADLVKEAHDSERALESAELIANPEVRVEIERRRSRLRHEIGRLVERFEMERRVTAAVEAAQAAAAADVAEKARERLGPRRAQAGDRAVIEQTKPWGCEVRDNSKGARHDPER